MTASVEEPAKSLMWSVPELVRVKNAVPASVLEVDYCKFGKSFRKRTMVWFLGTLSMPLSFPFILFLVDVAAVVAVEVVM